MALVGGAPAQTRTGNRQLRRLLLCPLELQAPLPLVAHDETEGVPHGVDGIMHHRKRCEKEKVHGERHPKAEKKDTQNPVSGQGRGATGRFDRLHACGVIQRISPLELSGPEIGLSRFFGPFSGLDSPD